MPTTTPERSLRAVLELHWSRRDPATGHVSTERTAIVHRRGGERLELPLASGSIAFVLRTVTDGGIALVAEGDLPAEVTPEAVVDRTAGALLLPIGSSARLAAPDRESSCAIAPIAIGEHDAPVLPGRTPLEDALLAAIRDALDDDDAPRRIYADWLLSQPAQSDRDRGELIQLQCALATAAPAERRPAFRARERELLAALPAPSLGDGVRLELGWVRGFLGECRGELADFARHAEEVFELAPLLTTAALVVTRWVDPHAFRTLAAHEPVARIRELEVAPGGRPPHWGPGDQLLAALVPSLAGLRRLHLTAMGVGERGLTSLVGPGGCAPLAMLALSDNPLGPGHARVLAGATHLRTAGLRLPRCTLAPDSVEALVGAPWLAALEELDLGDNALHDRGAHALARVPFAKLRSLALASCGIGAGGASALLRSPHLSRLRYLWMHDNPIGDAGALALARSRLRSLEELDLQRCAIGANGIGELAGSPGVRAARRWRLGSNPIGDAGARAIAESDHTRGLTSLDLTRCGVGDEGAVALAAYASESLALALVDNPIGDAGATALIESAARAVTLSAASLSKRTSARFRERFGDAALSA